MEFEAVGSMVNIMFIAIVSLLFVRFIIWVFGYLERSHYHKVSGHYAEEGRISRIVRNLINPQREQ